MIARDELIELLSYDSKTGVWTWRVNRSRGARVGWVAGSINGQGYREIKINQKTYEASRLAFLWMTGSWPHSVDHINQKLDDNRWCNLRETTAQEQCHNRRGWSTSGFKGVRVRKWGFVAVITVDGKRTYLGRRRTAAEAHELYRAAALKHFGAFARTNHIQT